MRVPSPPYDWVFLVADADAEHFLEALVSRGQERGCIAKARYLLIRDPKRDIVWNRPLDLLRPPVAIPNQHRVLACWDFHGSGAKAAAASEQAVLHAFTQAGFADEHVEAVCFDGELEALLGPVADGVLSVVGAPREMKIGRDAVLERLARNLGRDVQDHDTALAEHPKEWLEAALHLARLRRNPGVYEDLGRKLSLPALKQQAAAARIAATLQRWSQPG
jgi:hypothetical protein